MWTVQEAQTPCDLMILIMGMFLEGSSIMLIAAPLMAPVALALDINMLQFGIIMTLGIQVGQMTPLFNTAGAGSVKGTGSEDGLRTA